MPVTMSDIDQYRTGAQSAAGSASSFAAASPMVESELRDALAQKFTEYKEPIEQRNQAMADYLSSGANARSRYADPSSQNFVFNPYDRGKLIANEQSLAYKPYASLTDYINLAMGTVKDLASQGAGMYQAEANNRLSQAQLAQDQYTTALNEYIKMGELDLARQKQAESSSKSSSEDMFNNLLLQYVMGNGNQSGGRVDYGEEPTYSPLANGERVVNNEGIVWEFQDTKWVPIGTA